MAKAFRKKSSRRVRPLSRVCFFCEEKKLPHYAEQEELLRFITDRGKIMAHLYSGVCSKHQRILTRQIKYARHLGLVPFVQQIK